MKKKTEPLPPFVVFGAADPEQEAAEQICYQLGVPFGYAVGADGRRVAAARAYVPGNTVQMPDGRPIGLMAVPEAVLFECTALVNAAHITICDHHKPGDPGFRQPPSKFWQASSLGQLCAVLVRAGYLGTAWRPTTKLLMTAAADHCLGAAYHGDCPGINPDALMRWRAQSRAAFQKRPVEEIIADVEATAVALFTEARVCLLCGCVWGEHIWPPAADTTCKNIATHVVVVDMRREAPWPELPEAATRLGVGYISGPLIDRDGRHKFTCSGSSEQVSMFMHDWAPSQGFVGIYGDPARGFAGAYQP